jgi:S-adenosylmethionine synthetase
MRGKACHGCAVLVAYDKQSNDIAQGVDHASDDHLNTGAGDQGVIPDDKLADLVNEYFDLRPKGIIQMLDLLRPIYAKTAAYGHFGREEPEFSWERTDKAAALRAPRCILSEAVVPTRLLRVLPVRRPMRARTGR